MVQREINQLLSTFTLFHEDLFHLFETVRIEIKNLVNSNFGDYEVINNTPNVWCGLAVNKLLPILQTFGAALR